MLITEKKPIGITGDKGEGRFAHAFKKTSPKAFFEKHLGNGKPIGERKLKILLDNYNEAFSDFEDDEVPPSMKRIISEDFLKEIKGQYSEHRKKGPLKVELSIPKHLYKPESEENIIDKLKAHFDREAEDLKKIFINDKVRGFVYVITGMLVTSMYTTLKTLENHPDKMNFGALTAAAFQKLDYFFSFENMEAKIIAGLIYAVEVAGWFGLFMGFEKLIEQKVVTETSIDLKTRMKMARELSQAQYTFTQRTRTGASQSAEPKADAQKKQAEAMEIPANRPPESGSEANINEALPAQGTKTE